MDFEVQTHRFSRRAETKIQHRHKALIPEQRKPKPHFALGREISGDTAGHVTHAGDRRGRDSRSWGPALRSPAAALPPPAGADVPALRPAARRRLPVEFAGEFSGTESVEFFLMPQCVEFFLMPESGESGEFPDRRRPDPRTAPTSPDCRRPRSHQREREARTRQSAPDTPVHHTEAGNRDPASGCASGSSRYHGP